MREPARSVDRVALIGFSLLAALVVTQDLSWEIRAAAGAVLAVLAVAVNLAFTRGRSHRFLLVALALSSMSAGCFLLSVHQAGTERIQETLPQAPVTVTATVCDLPTYDGRYRYPLRIESVGGTPVSAFRAELVSRKDLGGDLGDAVEGEVRLLPCRERSDGTVALAYRTADGALAFREQAGGPRLWIRRLRQGLNERLDTLFDGDVRGLVKGILLGDTSAMSAGRVNDFRACGLSHTIVVSGLHMTVVSGVFLFLLRLVVRRRRLCAALACLPILLFTALCGFAPSALRAAVAAVAALLGVLVGEDIRCYTSLGWAIVVVALINPTLPTGLSFLLSVTSVLGLFGLGGRWQRRRERAYETRHRRPMPWYRSAISGTVLLTLGAQIGTLPPVLVTFSRVSLLSVPANLAVFLAVEAVLVFGTLALLTLTVGLAPLGYALGAVAGLAAKVPLAVTRWLSGVSALAVPTWRGWTALCVSVLLAVWLLALWRRRPGLAGMGAAAVAAVYLAVNLYGLTAVRLVITESGCFLREGDGRVSVIGFDDAYGGALDAEEAVSWLGGRQYGVLVWDDFSEWTACLRKRPADGLVTNRPISGALPEDRQETLPVRLTRGEMTYDCREGYTLVTCPGGTVLILQRSMSLEGLPAADWVIQPTASPDGTVGVTVWRNRGLAPERSVVYNEVGCTYDLTIGRSGRWALEKG